MLLALNTKDNTMYNIDLQESRDTLIGSEEPFLPATGAVGIGHCPQVIGQSEKRHHLTPLDPANIHAVAQRIGMQLIDKLHLEPLLGRVLGVMRMNNRPEGAEFIQLSDGYHQNACMYLNSARFCIALGPEPAPEKTADDLVKDFVDLLDTRGPIDEKLDSLLGEATAYLKTE